MTVNTSIGWTQNTWNPWQGCTHVSEGCDNCYMFTLMRRWGKDPEHVTRSKTTFRAPLSWKERSLVFTCSMSDWFHKDADPWRDEAWDIIRQTPQHTYQILTKRPGRIRRHLPADWGDGWPHVWLGVTVESQKVDHRIRHLIDVPARVRFLSCEPLLGPLSFPLPCNGSRFWTGIHWIIVGGESGQPHRPVSIEWIRSVVHQCHDAGCPVFVKQDSGPRPEQQGRIPDGLWLREFPHV